MSLKNIKTVDDLVESVKKVKDEKNLPHFSSDEMEQRKSYLAMVQKTDPELFEKMKNWE